MVEGLILFVGLLAIAALVGFLLITAVFRLLGWLFLLPFRVAGLMLRTIAGGVGVVFSLLAGLATFVFALVAGLAALLLLPLVPLFAAGVVIWLIVRRTPPPVFHPSP